MTDMNEKKLNQIIEKIIAGEAVDTSAYDDEVLSRLADIAMELHLTKPEPQTGFEESLRRGLQAFRDEQEEPLSQAGLERRWLPTWVTWRRAAAVAATLVVGLGVAGMTRAIIDGNGTLDDNGNVAIVSDDNRGAIEEKDMLQGDVSEASRGEDAVAPLDMDGESAGLAATEPLIDNTLTPETLRRVIKSADFEVEVPVGDFQDRYGDIADIAARYGGYVTYSDSSVSDNEDDQLKQGTITIRVANVGDNFSAAQNDIEGLGKVVSKQISGEDVTEEYVDLQSRLRNAEAQQASLLALMDKAGTIEEILLVQSRLDEVQLEIEQLKGSIEYMNSMTDFATLSVYMYEEDIDKEAEQNDEDGFDWGFVESIKYAGWLAVQTVNFVIIALGVLVPAFILVTLATVVTYRLMQRRRNKS